MTNSTKLDAMSDPSQDAQLPANLTWLRRLVTVLTIVMIIGMVLIVSLLFVKMRALPVQADFSAITDNLALPDGATASTVTLGDDWIGVVTDQGQFLIFDRTNGSLRQTITLQTGSTGG